MAALKTMFVLVLMAVILASTLAIYVAPCNQVCSRSNPEKEECCRAHGHRGHLSCDAGKMSCY